jgi:DNA/RNA endonuclease YhcR with UshA esterase domain
MPRLHFLILFLLVTISCASAQDVTIYQIQFTTDPGGDSPLRDSTVFTGGIVTGINFQNQPIRYYIADRTGGLWTGVLVNDNQDRQLAVGDSVRFQAQVQESSGQTRLRNIVTGTFSTAPQAGSVPTVIVATGAVDESTEGVLIEFHDAVVTDVSTDEFTVNDGSGAAIIGTGWSYSYSPLVGDTLRYVRGIVSSVNNAFTMNPRDDTDFGFFGNRPPLISNIQHSPASPTELETDTVTAMVVDEDGVTGARIYYRFGTAGDFNVQTMYDDGAHGDGGAADGTWGGVVPAGPARTTAYFYVCATDYEGADGCSPADAPGTTYQYVIRSSVLSIFDLQYTGNPVGGDSPYLNQTVTVTGIVTGTNFGSQATAFFMSDPGGGPWSGVYVFGPSLTPAVGDSVLVTGQITEFNGTTEFTSGGVVTVLGQGVVPDPLDVRIGLMQDSAEAYEGGLIRIGACVVTDISEWSTQYPAFEVNDPTGRCAVTKVVTFDYVPVVGDSFTSMTGCVEYYSGHGWELSPRSDADIAYVDRRAPLVESAEAVAPHEVNIRFNEPLSDAGISDLTNYTATNQSDPGFPQLHVESAYLFSTRRIIHLTFMEELDPDSAYRLIIHQASDIAGNVAVDAAIGLGGYEPGEITPIATLYDSFGVYNNRIVMLRGVVNFVQDVTTTSGSRRISAYMQDESGRGFSLSQSGPASDFPAIQRGNWIRITGLVNVFDGTIQLGSFSASDAVVLAEHTPLPDPVVVHTGDYRIQRRIVHVSEPAMYGAGTWVKTTGTIYRVDENVGGGTNISIDDGTGNLSIRVWDSMNLDSVQLNGQWYLLRELVGRYLNVSGPSSTYNGDFQMLAGYADDFGAPFVGGTPSEAAMLSVPKHAFAPDLGQTMTINYNTPATSQVRLRIFDLRGRLVRTLVDKPAGGPGIFEWDGRNDLREIVPMGTYILHLESVKNGKSDTRTKPIVVGTKL